MSARDVIAAKLALWGHDDCWSMADGLLKALAAAGYPPLGPDGIHAPSVERCAQIAEGYAPVFQDMAYAPLQEQADNIAAALRELMKEVR